MKIRNEKSVMQFITLCFYILLAASCLYFIIWQVSEPAVNPDGEGARIITGFTTADETGTEEPVRTDNRYGFNAEGTFTMHGTLPEEIRDECLCFMSFCDTDVYCGGKQLYHYDAREEARIPGGSVKSIHHFVQLDSSCSGQGVDIVFHEGMQSTVRAGEVAFGSRSDIVRMMFRKYGATFVMGLMLLCVAAVILICGLIIQHRTKQVASIVTTCVAVLVTAGWIVTDSNYYPFAFGHNHIDGLMSYLLCILLPSPFLAYLAQLQKGRHQTVYLIMQSIVLLSFVVFSILHFTGIYPFYESLVFIDIELVAAIIGIAVILLKEQRQGYVKAYRYTAIGFVCLMLCGFGEIVLVLLPHTVNTGGMILVGLLLLLCFAVAQQMEDSRVMDVERRKALEVSETKGAFLASMSHEIRTPINSMLGMNEMILRESTDPAIRSYASTIQRSGRMLLSLINDVLDYSRIEAGKLEIMKEEYRLSELLTDIEAIARERAEQKGLDFELHIAEGLPGSLYSDEVRIKQILMNLLSNAVKYTDEGSVSVFVGGAYTDDETFDLRFYVKDTGRGIREEDQAHLFEAFNRSDLKRNRSIEGTGLGLAIVKSITDSLGGTVGVESVYGKGSTFSVSLPQKVTDHTCMPTDLREIRSAAETRRGCAFTAPDAVILAVDDNRPNLSIVSAFLKDTKAAVDLCTNGTDAIRMCREKKYDLILLDHMMPEPDGIQTLETVRRDPDSLNRDTPAVVLTANAVAGIRQKYLEAGFADYLSKPISSRALEETVRKHLPAEKVKEAETAPAGDSGAGDVMEFEASGQDAGPEGELPESIRNLPGLDIEEALLHTDGSAALLEEILRDIAEIGGATAKELRQSAEAHDYERYRIAAHSVKGMMASIGAAGMSEEARKHEFAARDGDYAFVDAHFTEFARAYEDFCGEILKALQADG